jgi:hypothetical protein
MGEDYISAVGYGTVGAACLIVPSFTLSYSIRTDMERAVGAFNAASK